NKPNLHSPAHTAYGMRRQPPKLQLASTEFNNNYTLIRMKVRVRGPAREGKERKQKRGHP
ncbi:MAG: hypothetical protein ACKPKO_40345, partial [Candidatus Fonsibacter sp.]